MAKKKKKSKFKKYLILTGGFLVFGLFMLMGASSASVGTEGGRQESVVTAQTSILEAYLNNRSEEQIALVESAQAELTARSGTSTKGGDSYIETLNPSLLHTEESSSSSSESSTQSSHAESSTTQNTEPLNVQWDGYFIGQMMTHAGIEMSYWNAAASTFATKLHQNGKFNMAEGYIPREGDIVFWGKKLRSLSDGQTIKARHCGIVTKVEMITDHTLIKAMRITVIEGDVEGRIVNGNYSHSTSYAEAYIYDLYDTHGNNHHGSAGSYEQIMGYGTVVTDIEEVESTTDTSDYEHLLYTIDLQSTYEEAAAREGESS